MGQGGELLKLVEARRCLMGRKEQSFLCFPAPPPHDVPVGIGTLGGKEDTCRWQESLKEEGAELCPFTLGPGPRLWDLKRGSSTDVSSTVSTMGETLSLTWP